MTSAIVKFTLSCFFSHTEHAKVQERQKEVVRGLKEELEKT